ncbi:hypothetical protein ACFSKU_04765 [Pontibacter silvestris]|uniref:Lipoprotein n=1 Tax=Pontibacter silvestris TaxID=2305183 RepID=A0ABW4WTV5_9BACT|nr:hypothetical protein [Pontibacter silvestris]MCC9137289.1 hypothetical protein [Pontibacter silvestris]
MLLKLFTLYVYAQTLICGCGPDKRQGGFEKASSDYKVRRIGRAEATVSESSGLARADSSTFLTHPDAGNAGELYKINLEGELLQKLPLELNNVDWEDMAEDDKGYLYIGDFGNNLNKRKDLHIYKLNRKDYSLAGIVSFSFEDQTAFPPGKHNLTYDLEAFFYHADSLYLFTKSRGRHKHVKLYKLPAVPGEFKAQLQEQLPLHTMVTAADISPTNDEFAVLGYGKLYLFDIKEGRINLQGRRRCITVGRTGQAEGVLYLDKDYLLLTNENGKLFMVSAKNGSEDL